ncbi:hypothetical protein J6590_079490 [Homalodisca vitripennis]|nr:hypothetical protein J6590_079490 [Homalodisca vitripennis]
MNPKLLYVNTVKARYEAGKRVDLDPDDFLNIYSDEGRIKGYTMSLIFQSPRDSRKVCKGQYFRWTAAYREVVNKASPDWWQYKVCKR